MTPARQLLPITLSIILLLAVATSPAVCATPTADSRIPDAPVPLQEGHGTMPPHTPQNRHTFPSFAGQRVVSHAAKRRQQGSSSQQPQSIKLCHIPVQYISNDRIFARHALFATQYLAPRFPELNISFSYATLDGGPTIQRVALGMLSEDGGASCDGFIGPQWSSVSISVSPLITRPWVSHTATSTRLSDKAFHPWFSRLLPTDDFAGAGMAATVNAFGWTRASALCVDDGYGQSLLSGFSRHLSSNGGSLERAACFVADASAAEVRSAVDIIRTVDTRVVAIAGASSRPALGRLVDEIVAQGLHRSHVFVFSESACAAQWERLRDMPGALCISYSTNDTVAAPYRASWAAHDPQALFGWLPALGIPELADPYAIGLYSFLVHDCALKLLTAFATHVRAGGSAKDYKAVLDLVRSQELRDGATGPLKLSAVGDREGALLEIKNVQPAPAGSSERFVLRRYAHWSPDEGIVLELEQGEQLYWLARGYGAPPEVEDRESTAFRPSAVLLIALLSTVVILVILVVVVVKMGCSDAGTLARAIHSGAAGAFILALADTADAVIGGFAAVVIFSDDGYSDGFRYSFLAATVVATFGAIIDVVTILLFLYAFITANGRLTPQRLQLWHLRMAKSSAFSLCIEDLPMLGLAFAAILLQPDGQALEVIAIFIVSAIIAGAKFVECGTLCRLVSMSSQKALEELHADIRKEFSAIVPLGLTSSYEDVRAVGKFIAKRDPMRWFQLNMTAKHIVVDALAQYRIDLNEFFAVVWMDMARFFVALHNIEFIHDEAGARAESHSITPAAASVTPPSMAGGTNHGSPPTFKPVKFGDQSVSLGPGTSIGLQRFDAVPAQGAGQGAGHTLLASMHMHAISASGRSGLAAEDDDLDDSGLFQSVVVSNGQAMIPGDSPMHRGTAVPSPTGDCMELEDTGSETTPNPLDADKLIVSDV